MRKFFGCYRFEHNQLRVNGTGNGSVGLCEFFFHLPDLRIQLGLLFLELLQLGMFYPNPSLASPARHFRRPLPELR